MNNRILIVEDEPELRDYLGIALKRQGYQIDFAEEGEEALSFLARSGSEISLMLLDIIMPRKDGLDTLREVRRTNRTLPIVMLSGSCATSHVIQAMKSGADDFLQKPVSYDELSKTIERVLQGRPDTCVRGPIVEQIQSKDKAFASNWVNKIEKFFSQIGESDMPVLLRGETGVGKEVFARQLHARSARRDKPFLKVNCAALPSELVESELFGYERGAFTGAFKASEGRFKQAHGGTIFLDEIGDMDVKLQAKLLQVLQDKEFLRLGSKEATRVDVRVMAATHCDLEQSITDGKFREDLYYRLNVIDFEIPALRHRKDEILGLANHFLAKYGTEGVPVPEMNPALKLALMAHDWPGNIRELENVMRKFLVLRDCDMVCDELQRTRRKVPFLTVPAAEQPAVPQGVEKLSSFVPVSIETPRAVEVPELVGTLRPGASIPMPMFEQTGDGAPLSQVDQFKKNAESTVILSTLKSTRWNRRQAAEVLNIDYKALLYKMKKLGITA